MAFYTHLLEDDEQVVAIVRSHMIYQLGRIIRALIILLAPFFFLIPLFEWGQWGIAVFVLGIVWGVILLFRIWVIAYSDSLIVTNYRVIDWNQRGLFDHIVSDVALEDIREVAFRVKGIVGTILNIGTVYLYTNQEDLTISLPAVKHPVKVQSLLKKMR